MRKVLLIEDDALLCWLLEKILKNQFEVVIMNDGMEAWSWLAGGNVPDLIVSDLKMPGLGGIELLEKINGSKSHKNIPLIIHSGYEDAIKRKQCLDLGAFAYLVKPFEPEFLVAEVERALKFGNQKVLVK